MELLDSGEWRSRITVGDDWQGCGGGVSDLEVVEWQDAVRKVIWRGGWDNDELVWYGFGRWSRRGESEAEVWACSGSIWIKELMDVGDGCALWMLAAGLVKSGESMASGWEEESGERYWQIVSLGQHGGDGLWLDVTHRRILRMAHFLPETGDELRDMWAVW